MFVRPKIEITDDGSPTLKHPILGDYYHSLRGARAESKHIFIEAGFDTLPGDYLRILEVGFGSGLNAWLTLLRAEECGRRVDYTALELYPVDEMVISKLPYSSDARFVRMHSLPWGEAADIDDCFRLMKIEADLLNVVFVGVFDVVYFDAFAPDTQPELWSIEVFSKIFNALSDGGVLVTYSAKGDVKRALREAGFEVSRLRGALGKRHMLRAVKLQDKGV